ncbi:MAG: T9SS type A sorting domain-containing protein [Saprospiraceae bacterium]
MNKLRLSLMGIFCLILFARLNSQVHLKLEQLNGSSEYGVYVQVCPSVNPSGNTITGSGQITVVFPSALQLTNLQNKAGLWTVNAAVIGPDEAPDMAYVSIGFSVDNPQIIYSSDTPTLLFTFKLIGSAAGSPHLIENGVDPFDQLPNSESSNPGNELSVVDFGASPMGLYSYEGNFVGTLDCGGTNPQDTTNTNPQDTTNTNPQDTTNTNPQDTTVTNPQDTVTGNPQDTTLSSGVFSLKKNEFCFTLSPNPTQDWITVTFEQGYATMEGTVRFWTSSGIALGSLEKGRNQSLHLNVDDLPAGIYFLSYEVNGKTLQRERFLKQ